MFDGIHCNTAVAALEESGSGVTASFEGDYRDGPQTFDNVLLSAGRVPNTENLGLEHTRVGLSNAGFIEVDGRMRTADSRIFALGDVVDGPGLAHKAAHQGKVAAEVIAGQPAAFDGIVPSVVYTDPEIAWCGADGNRGAAYRSALSRPPATPGPPRAGLQLSAVPRGLRN